MTIQNDTFATRPDLVRRLGLAQGVAGRLEFLTDLDAIVGASCSPEHLGERGALHSLIGQHTWLFGEEFNLAVEDPQLTEVLRTYQAHFTDDILIDTPTAHVCQRCGVGDLALSRVVRDQQPNSYTHLVILLKAPGSVLDRDDLEQIEEYARAVVTDDRFSNLCVRWLFWVVGDALGPVARFRVDNAEGDVLRRTGVAVRFKTWARLIGENRTRLRFFENALPVQRPGERSSGEDTLLAAMLKEHECFVQEVLEELFDSADDDEDAAPPASAEDVAPTRAEQGGPAQEQAGAANEDDEEQPLARPETDTLPDAP